MKGIDQYLAPYLISQAVGIFMLVAAALNVRVARILFWAMFLFAGTYNMYIGLVSPDTYLDFAPLALPFYRNFINGWFSSYNHIVIPLIAAGQLMISLGMLLNKAWINISCIAGIIFLMAIIPLMVGSAFPFSIPVIIAAYLILRHPDKKYIWTKADRSTKPKVHSITQTSPQLK